MPVTHVAEQAGSAGNRALKPCKAHGASRSESEPGSASKRYNESGQPFRDGEASTGGEDTGMCTRRALRGGRGQRVPREGSRNLRRPGVPGSCPRVRLGMHNQHVLHGRAAEGSVVAGKRGNSRGAKGPCRTGCEVRNEERPLASRRHYGRRGGIAGGLSGQRQEPASEALRAETEAVPEGEARAEVPVLRTIRPDLQARRA